MIISRVAFAGLASATLAMDAQPAAAEIYRPWCVQYGGSDGDNGTTCAFTSFEQCMLRYRCVFERLENCVFERAALPLL